MEIVGQHSGLIFTGLYALLEVSGLVAAVHAVMHVRTAQGSIAWLVALVAMPVVALPLYATFGRRKFSGYVDARRAGDAAIEHVIQSVTDNQEVQFSSDRIRADKRFEAFEHLARMQFTTGNATKLLIDGEATFLEIFKRIADARSYVLVQFYIIRDDELGRALSGYLISCLERDVRVYLLYDAVGSVQLSSNYIAQLREAGADVCAFAGTSRRVKRFQINFRNHRKIVVVDGQTAFIGGLNVGDEYLGKHAQLTPWRDTHLMLEGPAATASQVSFIQDWYWSSQHLPTIDWSAQASQGDRNVLVVPSGPADDEDTCGLTFLHAINEAQKRLWIVSPYFVPNGSIIDGLKLAVLRGVDVRLLLPMNADSHLVQLAGKAYVPDLVHSGVRVFRFEDGFLHQKVMLVDDDLATVGTANLDNRSFRLNFEITVIVSDASFASEVEEMLVADFARAAEVGSSEIAARRWWLRAAARGARLLSPIL